MRFLKAIIIAIIIFLFTILFVLNVFDRPQVSTSKIVGILSSNSFRLSKVEGLEDGLREYGFSNGDNVEFIIKNAKGEGKNLLPLAEELVREADVIVTTGRIETEIAKKVTRGTDIPVIFMGLTTAKEDDLLQDLLHPKSGITGVQNDHAALSGKRLELLSKLLPTITKVLVISDPNVKPTEESISATRNAAKVLELELEIVSGASFKEINNIFAKNLSDINAILLLPSFFLESEGARLIATMAIERRLPVMGVENNAKADLFSVYGVTSYDQGKQAARILAKVLRGDKVEDIPVEPPTDLRLSVNLEVARRLGIDSDIDESFLGFAEVVNAGQGEANDK